MWIFLDITIFSKRSTKKVQKGFSKWSQNTALLFPKCWYMWAWTIFSKRSKNVDIFRAVVEDLLFQSRLFRLFLKKPTFPRNLNICEELEYSEQKKKKKLCMAKPEVRWAGVSLSPTNARNGSIEILIDASSIHNIPPAIHKVGELGITKRASVANMAPIKKKGLLLPQYGCQVLSHRYPTIGWINKPVSGAAIHKMGISSLLAPSVSNIRLTLEFCN